MISGCVRGLIEPPTPYIVRCVIDPENFVAIQAIFVDLKSVLFPVGEWAIFILTSKESLKEVTVK